MKLPKPGEGGGDREPVPAGTHLGVCYRFIDMGTQKVEWQGNVKHLRKVMISWITPDELMSDGKPFSVHKRYTWSMHEKAALRHDLESWRGKAFTADDFEGANAFNTKKLLGQPCMLTVTHDMKDGKTYTNVASVGKLMKGVQVPKIAEATVYLSLEPGEFDQTVFDSLGDGIKERIAQSPEFKELGRKSAPAGHVEDADDFAGHDPSDDIPF